jgi:hypothetical protein
MIFDYLFLVKSLNPPVYYKLEVYIYYYASTFLIGVEFAGK